MADARFEDGEEGPLRLLCDSADDLAVIAALVQDAVLPATEMRYDRARRRFALLINRFRWEDGPANAQKRPYERVRSLLTIEDVGRVRSAGIDRKDAEQVLSILDLAWVPGDDGMGTLTLVLAAGAALELSLEALSLRLEDVTKPYLAPSGQKPDHGV